MKKLFILLLLSGCGKAPTADYTGFENYVNSFLVEARSRNVTLDSSDLKIHVVTTLHAPNLAQNTVGVCSMPGQYIELLKSFWDGLNDAGKESLLYHEMGHCLMGLEHTTCENVMCEHTMNPFDYSNNRAHYLDVLFNG